MDSISTENYTYLQFNKKLGHPIYLRLRTSYFDDEMMNFLRAMRFDELTEEEGSDALESLETTAHARLLTISEASMVVSKQIDSTRESDKYGLESIVNKKGYTVYRYKNVAMLVHSAASSHWHMGCYPDFGNINNELSYRVVINRFLSWAMAPLGIIGFWGTPVEDGVVIQKYIESGGEAVFFDVNKRSFISVDGQKRMRYSFQLIKLDPILKDTSIDFKFENLLSFLSVNTTYFGATGLPSPVRQLVQSLCRITKGTIFPLENYRPRQEGQLAQE